MYRDLDGESGELTGLTSTGSFSEESIRKGFIRKLYGILTIQLALTMGVMGIIMTESIKAYTASNIWLFWVTFFVSFGFLIALACCEDLRRKSPNNMICLAAFTAAEGLLLGVAMSTYRANGVLLAVGICALIVLGLTIFALQTRIYFTMMNGILFVLVLCLVLFGLFCVIFRSQIMMVVYASLGAIIFSCYIVVDTHLMMEGKHQYSLDPEEYVFASLNLYLDIINPFLIIIRLIEAALNSISMNLNSRK